MTDIHGKVSTHQSIGGRVKSSSVVNGEINISGGKKVMYVYQATTAEWNSRPSLISEKGALYIYTDYQNVDGMDVPGFKLGDGKAYLIDMPFTDSVMQDHIRNTIVHITQEEREFWNDKVRCYAIDNEELVVFTTD